MAWPSGRLIKRGPLTILWRPDVPPVIPGQNLGKPTAETVADALIRYETGGCCGFGTTCGLCDCGRADQTPERQQEWDAHQLDRARAVLALIPPQRCAPSRGEVLSEIVDALDSVGHSVPDGYLLSGRPDEVVERFEAAARGVMALYGDRPTVAQAKAEALRAAADELDRDAAEGRAARRVAGVRCLRCDLRHEEREEYSCQIEGTAHDYDDAELAEATRPDGETSWIGDRLRARANDIESGAEHG